MRGLSLLAALVLFAVSVPASAEEKETKVELSKVPKAVLDAVKEEYAGAEVKAAETFEDDGETLYEVELTADGKSVDVVLDEDGEIYEAEEEIDVEDLPKEVAAAVMAKYPGAKITEAEEVTEYEDDEEESEAKEEKKDAKDADHAKDTEEDEDEGETYYEVEVTTADGKSLEVEVSEDGKEVEAEADDAAGETEDADETDDADEKEDGGANRKK